MSHWKNNAASRFLIFFIILMMVFWLLPGGIVFGQGVDSTAPVISLNGANPVSIVVGTSYTDAGATAVDDVSGDVSIDMTKVSTVSEILVGEYTVTYSASDAAGNVETAVRNVNVIEAPTVTNPPDTTPPTTSPIALPVTVTPVIILNGDSNVVISVDSEYSDSGATATDWEGKDITSAIVAVNTVDTSLPGSYTVTYNVSDAAGNAATEVTRKVEVVEPVPEVDVTQPVEIGQVGAAVLENVKADSIELDSIAEDITASDLITEDAEQIPSLITDKPDYAPTDTVLIIGNGFITDKTYILVISSTDSPSVNFEVQVTADKSGTFVYAYQLDGTYRPNYRVEVKGSEILTTFTDSISVIPGVLFESTFDNLNGLTQLTPWLPAWSILNGNLKPSTDTTADKIVVFGDSKWQDYNVSVNANLIAGKGYGIYYRSSVNSLNKISGYIFQYDPGWNKSFVLRKVIDGNESAPIRTTLMPAGFNIFGSSHKIDISVEGDHHVIMVDGVVVMDFHDSGFTQGLAGFRAWGGSDVNFEDVKVTDKKAAAVTKITPDITWSVPEDITYGTALGSKQLNATASTGGTFVYDPTEGTILNQGSGQSLSVIFTPTDSINYDTASKTVLISVVKASQTITFTNPGDKTYGDAAFDLSASSTSGLPVSLSVISGPTTLDGANLTITGAGDVVIRASQAGTSSYNAADNVDVAFNVGKAALTVTADAKSKIYGDMDPELTYQITSGSLVKGDSFTGSLTRDKGEDIGTYAITQGTLSLSKGYTLTYTAGIITINSINFSESSFDNMDGLTQLKGPWSIKNGNLKPSTDANTLFEKIVVFGDSKWQDYSVSVNTALIAGSGYGIYYRASVNTENNISGYIFQYDPGWYKSFILRKVVNGNESAPIRTTLMPAGFNIFGSSHKIDISVEGDHHVIMVDGVVVMDFHDSGFTQGLAGFRTWNYSDVNFEDVKVTDKKAAVVTKITPDIAWSNPDDITYGTALGAKQLNATASTDGTFVYSPTEGTVLNQGSDQSLSVTFTPTDSINYNTASKTVLLSVVKANQTIIFTNPGDKTYGDAAFSLAASSTSGLPVSFSLISGPATLDGANLTITGAKDVIVRALQEGNSNYNAADNVDVTFGVGKAALTVTADAKSKIYGDMDPELTYQITSGSLVKGDSFTGSLKRAEGKDVGDYNISSTLSAGDNYSIKYIAANLTIKPAALTITADSKSKIYGDMDPELTYQITSGSLVKGDSFTGSLKRAEGKDVGDYNISSTLSAGDNYSIKYIAANLTIKPAALTITADNSSKIYGSANPVFTVQYSGFVAGDTSLSLKLQPIVKTTATATSLAGTYPINASRAYSSNYTIDYKPGILTVTYHWYGFLQPLKTTGKKSVFKLGSTIPVKFKIDGDVPKKTVANISFSKIANASLEAAVNEAVSTSAATTGTLFRYSAADDQYIYNLSTKNLTAGEYTIKAVLDDGKQYSIHIILSAKKSHS